MNPNNTRQGPSGPLGIIHRTLALPRVILKDGPGQHIAAIATAGDLGQTLREATEKPSIAAELGAPFLTYDVTLSDSDLATGRQLPASGARLIYLRDGSAAAGRLHVDFGGARVPDFHPGASIIARFGALTIVRSSRSTAAGNARIVVVKSLTADYLLPTIQAGQASDPVDLLGSSAAGTFVSVNEDTEPSGAAPAGSFTVTGWRKIRVLIDTQTGGVPATTFDLIPWLRDPNTGNWYAQTDARLSLPDTDGGTSRWRVFTLDVEGTGLMFFEIRNLLLAARTALGFIVQGLE